MGLEHVLRRTNATLLRIRWVGGGGGGGGGGGVVVDVLHRSYMMDFSS